MFFSCGTVEERATHRLKKGKAYKILVEFGRSPTSKLEQGSNIPFGHGALRIGGAKVIDPEVEIGLAVSLAKEAEQVVICAGLNVSPPYSFNQRLPIEVIATRKK